MRTKIVMYAAGLLVATALGAFTAMQTGFAQISECWCGGATCPIEEGTDPKVDVRKAIDLGIHGDDDGAQKGAAQTYLQSIATLTVQVNDVEGAVAAINARALELGRPVHVAILDHAAGGEHDIGKETIGVKDPHSANLDQFVSAPPVGVAGNVQNLNLLGCSPAQGSNGQEFISELSKRLGAEEVKGYTSPTYNEDDGNRNLRYKGEGEKEKVGGVAELPEGAGLTLEGAASGDDNSLLPTGVAGTAASAAAGVLAVGCAAWFVRRRLIS